MQRRNPTRKTRDITILSDSHGREVAAIMGCSELSFNVIGIIKPGAPLKEVVKDCERILKPGSDCVLIGGANDVYRNKNKCAESALTEALQKTPDVNYFIVSIPRRHDLTKNSPVNHRIESMNKSLEKICSGFANATFICTNSTVRRHFTRHGLHRNRKGKEAMTTEILKVMKSCTDEKISPTHLQNSLLPETNDRSPTAEVVAPAAAETMSATADVRSPTPQTRSPTEESRTPREEGTSPPAEATTLAAVVPAPTADHPTLAADDTTKAAEDNTLAAEDPVLAADYPAPGGEDPTPIADYPAPAVVEDPPLAAEDPSSSAGAARGGKPGEHK